ncbi:glycine betaine ABC transporter substrate-binding protein [Gracilimonas sp. Q87]|uniref:glycine betaine ABC transporter substrate-binding protein n=1 Tax=Gracilimonas sp. Q87 TaxID=3384766 RepID=UPI0039841065
MRRHLGRYFLACLVLLTGVLGACGNMGEEEEKKEIRLVYADWSEGVAMTYLAAEILQTELGYEVETKMTDIESVFREIESGDYDLFVDAWLPETHKTYMNNYGADLENLGVNVETVRTGLMVPNYVEAQTIGELDSVVDQIIGIGSGAGVMEATKTAIESYGLSAELMEGSEQMMTDTLSNAIKRREPIVVTGWTPHWIMNRYELRFLDDPENVFGETEQIYTLAREGFSEENSRAATFFERYKLTNEQLGTLMDELQTFPNNEQRAVQNWIKDNEFIVNQWVKELHPIREKLM